MATTQFVSKIQLIELIKKVIDEQDTGLISILTDSNRSVLLKFSEGKLIHSYCRTRDVGEVIQVINEAFSVKFSMVPIPLEAGFEVMPGPVFLQLLEAGVSDDTPTSPTSPTRQSASAKAPKTIEVESAKDLLENIAAEYVGLVAEVIVEEALENSSTLEGAIEFIAGSIPDENQAASFREEAKEATRLISM